jgi:hypothetical protein
MKGSTKVKVFVSYSWTSESHKKWVLDLSERLSADGVHVILDEWDLKPGHDKYTFMEQMVTDESVKKVLVICDKAYQAKADGRKGGVGTESQLISKEVYEKVDQEKFIPIIVERDDKDEPCMPKYIASRVYFDLSKEATFETEYQNLLRNLYDKPDKKRPPVGEPPAYITEEAKSLPKSASVLRAGQSSGSGTSTNAYILEFFDQFLTDMKAFIFKPVSNEHYDDIMVKLVEQMRPLRDSFIAFIYGLARLDLSQEDLDLMHDYLEKIAQYQYRPYEYVGAYRDSDWDNYRFFNYELMLYLISVLLRYGKFKEVASIVNSTYFYDANSGQTKYRDITIFNEYVKLFDDQRNRRLQLNRVSVTADMIKSRAEESGVEFNELLETDLLLHYITFLKVAGDVPNWRWQIWFPRLTPYASRRENIPLLDKLVSARHFERIKNLLGVDKPNELKTKIEQLNEKINEYYQGVTFNYSIPMITSAIPVDSLATVA